MRKKFQKNFSKKNKKTLQKTVDKQKIWEHIGVAIKRKRNCKAP
jgi:hypothetical protein